MPESLIFCGRTFCTRELELMRQTALEFSALGVTEIARTVCELLEWKRPSGGLKNHECRQLLERLQAEGFLPLPDRRKLGGRGPRRADVSGSCCEPAPLACDVSECEPLELILVEGAAESRRWRERVERYHYLGCRVPFGAHLRYWVRHRERELACLLWTSPAWKMQARDEWIGWNDEQRRRHLQSIVNNGRFLVLPRKANILHLLRKDNAEARARAKAGGHRQHRLGKDPFQLGGSFVFGPGDVDLFVYVSRTFGDNAPLARVLEAIPGADKPAFKGL